MLPLMGIMHARGFTNGKCPRCQIYKETLKHAFWSCATVKEWWNQMKAILIAWLKVTISRLTFTFGIWPEKDIDPDLLWILQHLRYHFLWLIWSTRNHTVHTGELLFQAGLPWEKIAMKLQEDAIIYSQQPSLHALIQQGACKTG